MNSMGILFTDDALQLTPQEWTSDDNHWTVRADQTPMVNYALVGCLVS